MPATRSGAQSSFFDIGVLEGGGASRESLVQSEDFTPASSDGALPISSGFELSVKPTSFRETASFGLQRALERRRARSFRHRDWWTFQAAAMTMLGRTARGRCLRTDPCRLFLRLCPPPRKLGLEATAPARSELPHRDRVACVELNYNSCCEYHSRDAAAECSSRRSRPPTRRCCVRRLLRTRGSTPTWAAPGWASPTSTFDARTLARASASPACSTLLIRC